MRDLRELRFSGVIIACFGFLTGCEDGALPDLIGRYQGVKTEFSQSRQIIAQVSDFKKTDSGRELSVAVYETLGSSTSELYKIIVRDEEKLDLVLPEKEVIGLKLKANCATGNVSGTQARLCWEKGKIELQIRDRELTLERNDGLAPFPGANPRTYSLDEVMGRARFLNYTVSQEAERVYQAKQNIGVARGNLLPKLNFRSILGIITGDFISAIGSLLPFLFPSNWYRFEAAKHQYEAEKSSFASMRGNEMNAVEGMFYLLLRDQAVLTLVKNHLGWMRETKQGLEQEEAVGILPNGTAEYYEATIALLEKDRIALENFVRNEYAQLAHAVALPPVSGISDLQAVAFPDLTQTSPVHPTDFYRDAQTKSFEVKTLVSLTEVAKTYPGEILFSFLDPDGSGGLGFGTPSSLRIAKSQLIEIQKKTDETYSLIELRSALVASEYNQAIETYLNYSNAHKTTQKQLERLIYAHLLGDNTVDEREFVNGLTDFQIKLLGFKAEMISSSQVWMTAKAKIQRLLLQGFYGDLDAAIPFELEKVSAPTLNASAI